jgi:hypothetical protein
MDSHRTLADSIPERAAAIVTDRRVGGQYGTSRTLLLA